MKKIVKIKGYQPAEFVWKSKDGKHVRVRWSNLEWYKGEFLERDIPIHLVISITRVKTKFEMFFINLFKRKKK